MESCSSQKCYKDANIGQQKNKQPGIAMYEKMVFPDKAN
jgi:hypothetical protein